MLDASRTVPTIGLRNDVSTSLPDDAGTPLLEADIATLDYAERLARRQDLRRLESQITEIVGHLNAGTYRFLRLIARYDRLQGWSDGATHSCAHWLNWKCGLALGAARERLRVAHALEALPKVSATMATGELSYSKVRAITRVATPATEEYFLDIARHGTAHHVETLVRCFRQVKEAEELSREARQYANRGLTYLHDVDGSLVIKARLTAEAGALLIRALEAAEAYVPPVDDPTVTGSSADVPAGTCAPFDPAPHRFAARRVDALALIAESFLAHGAETLGDGDRHQIVVHVDADTLRHSTAGRCELEDGPSVAAETALRLACDASVVTITEDEHGTPLDVGRKTRSIPPAIRRALRSRDRGCRFPGCTHKRYVDGHHIHHWARGGATRLSNLVTLCRFHHRLVHEGRILIQELDDGALRFVDAHGDSYGDIVDFHHAPTDWTALVAANRADGATITATTAVTSWRGERLDYGMAIETLLGMEHRNPDCERGRSRGNVPSINPRSPVRTRDRS
jgi:Domain of unknown function (DUF222)/HNH endonuclease